MSGSPASMNPRLRAYLARAEKVLSDPDKSPQQHAAARRVVQAAQSWNPQPQGTNSSPPAKDHHGSESLR